MNKTTHRKVVKRQAPQKRLEQQKTSWGAFFFTFFMGYIFSLFVPIQVVTSEGYCPNQSCPSSQHIILRGNSQ